MLTYVCSLGEISVSRVIKKCTFNYEKKNWD
jgi:hypothetical protein